VALAREVLGGNGIIYDNVVARHFLDMEAAYTYEGTYEVNALYVTPPPFPSPSPLALRHTFVVVSPWAGIDRHNAL
jgi:hypothetical protein